MSFASVTQYCVKHYLLLLLLLLLCCGHLMFCLINAFTGCRLSAVHLILFCRNKKKHENSRLLRLISRTQFAGNETYVDIFYKTLDFCWIFINVMNKTFQNVLELTAVGKCVIPQSQNKSPTITFQESF